MKKERGCFFLRIVCKCGKIKVYTALAKPPLLLKATPLSRKKFRFFLRICLLIQLFDERQPVISMNIRLSLFIISSLFGLIKLQPYL
jgi:hypothetical protein